MKKPLAHNERVCPTCKKIVTHTSKEVARRSEGKECFDCAQKNPEKARKVSLTNKGKAYNKSNLGKKQSPEWIAKRSQALKGRVPGFGGKKHSIQTRQKMSQTRLNELVDRYGNGQISPWYNKEACQLFEEINSTMGWNGQHAERGGEVKVGGYFLDYYEPSQNLVIEFDEKRHQIPSVKEKDKIKQKVVTQILKCRCVRIKEGKESIWKNLL